MLVTREAARHLGLELAGATVAIQGFGNVGSVAASLLAQAGARVVAVTDSHGGVHAPDGLAVPALIDYHLQHKTVARFPGAAPITNKELFGLAVDVLIPAALENQITRENAPDVRARIVVEGANGPTTPEAHHIMHKRGVLVVPDILANSGGVTASYFEWVQDRHGYFWTEQEVNERLEAKMCAAFDAVLKTALKHEIDLRTAAYMAAVSRVATVTKMRGMYA
jgi:glutamate dehydrogenase (NAD(P)+)